MQIPFGTLSDRLGRKPIIALGLMLFAFGSCIAAMSNHITGVIVGRAIQGAGAIGSTCLALVADLTRDENRSKAMALVGMTIGLSFCVAIIIGPLLYTHFELSGLFWFTALLALVAFLILFFAVPNPPRTIINHKTSLAHDYRSLFSNMALQRMNFSIFAQHAILTMMFLALPIILTQQLLLTDHQQTLLYLTVIVLAFIAMAPLMIIGEKKRKLKGVLLFAVATIAISQLLALDLPHDKASIALLLFLFFLAFTLLESILPSLVSKIAPLKLKGTAMGVYSTCQFAGIFVGGVLGGVALNHFSLNGLFVLTSAFALLWLLTLVNMAQPPYYSTLILSLPEESAIDDLTDRIKLQAGVGDVVISSHEKLIYIKVDKQKTSENELRNLLEKDNLSSSE